MSSEDWPPEKLRFLEILALFGFIMLFLSLHLGGLSLVTLHPWWGAVCAFWSFFWWGWVQGAAKLYMEGPP